MANAFPLVQTGTFNGSVTEPDWTFLDVASESQDRIFERFVRFDRRYTSKPVVQVSLVGFDIDNSRNARISISAEHVSVDGFSIQIRTWLNTRMWSVEASWLAIGPA